MNTLSHLLLPREMGFCLTHNQLSGLADGLYRVVIDADLAPGHLSYGQLLIPGESDDTILFSLSYFHYPIFLPYLPPFAR